MACFAMLWAINVSAQIEGNGTLKSLTIPVKGLTEIDIQFNASITLDSEAEETLQITADENVIEHINIQYVNGKLTLDQKKWIEPSRLPTIIIGTPKLESVYQGTHSTTIIKNIKASSLNLKGNVGKLIVDGSTINLTVVTTGTDIDLTNLEVVNAHVSIDDDSKVILNKVGNLHTDLDEDARLILLSDIDNYSKSDEEMVAETNRINPNLKWINFKIKNNSARRNHFVVEGPKSDGSKFSYGFSLLPGSKKEERWSVGTKIYKEKRSGSRELLVTIKSSDEGEEVDLFP